MYCAIILNLLRIRSAHYRVLTVVIVKLFAESYVLARMANPAQRRHIWNCMMRNCGILPLSGALLVGMLATGCSTYEVRDVYLPVDESQLEYQSETLHLKIAFDPDTRFYSAGIAGIPVIPTVVDPDGPSMLTLAVDFQTSDQLEFSFAHAPCASFDRGDLVCPFETEVVARAMSVDDGSMYADQRPRWHRIEEFSGTTYA
jgi:hypothetical protein